MSSMRTHRAAIWGAQRRLVRRGSTSEVGRNPVHLCGGILDCFAQPVVGRAFARPVGSQWRRGCL